MQVSIGRFWTSIILLAVALCLAPSASAQTSETDFTRQMAERFRAALPGRTVETTEPLQLRINIEPETSNINVARIFNFCANATDEECEASIDRFVSATVEGIETLDDPLTREQLRVVVRNTEYCDSILGVDAPDAATPMTRPYLPGLCMLIMADFPNRMHSLNTEMLAGMGLAPDAAWALAERQTLAILPRPETLEGLEDSVVIVTVDYVTSLLVDTEGWRTARARYGDILAAIPASDAMIVVRATTISDLDSLKAAVLRHMETAERGVSPTIYRFGATGWVPVE